MFFRISYRVAAQDIRVSLVNNKMHDVFHKKRENLPIALLKSARSIYIWFRFQPCTSASQSY